MTKRIISVLLALVLVLALSTSALAETVPSYNAVTGDFTLTVNDTETDREYTAYQIFKGTLGQVGSDLILGEIGWGDDVNTSAEGFPFGSAAETAATITTPAQAKDFAETISNYLKPSTKVETYNAEKGAYVFEGLTAGYYLVAETTENIPSNSTASAFMLEVVANAVATPKRSDVPDYDKKILGPSGEKVNMSENEIGDEVEFEITATIPSGYDKFETYELTFHDTMAPGLELLTDTIEYSIDAGVTLPAPITTVEGKETLTYSWQDITDIEADLTGKTITITYKAKVTSDAVKGVDGNPNAYQLEYTNAPEKTVRTTEKKVYVFTFDLNGVKKDGKNEKTTLAGAQFVLANGDPANVGTLYYKNAGSDVEWDTYENAKVVTSAADGTFKFEGLESGVYYLVEKEAPAGYNKLQAPVKVEIKATNDTNVVTKLETITYDAEGNSTTGDSTTVYNNRGTTLPETGGIGTTIFYLVGGLMMAAAVVLLVAKKRTVNE